MKFNDINVNQVFDEYAKIMSDKGHLEKKANYSLPEFVVGNNDYSEIEINDVLQRMASEKLYELDSEDVLGGAHPEGSTKIVDAPDGLGEVETLEATQKKIHDIAEKKIKLAKMVVALINDLDKNGFSELTKDLDNKLAGFLGTNIPTKTAQQAEEAIVQLSDLVGGAFTESNILVDHYRDELNNHLAELAMNPSEMALREFPKMYYKYLEHLWSRPEGKAVAKNMYSIYNDVVSLSDEAAKALAIQPVDVFNEPASQEEMAPDQLHSMTAE